MYRRTPTSVVLRCTKRLRLIKATMTGPDCTKCPSEAPAPMAAKNREKRSPESWPAGWATRTKKRGVTLRTRPKTPMDRAVMVPAAMPGMPTRVSMSCPPSPTAKAKAMATTGGRREDKDRLRVAEEEEEEEEEDAEKCSTAGGGSEYRPRRRREAEESVVAKKAEVAAGLRWMPSSTAKYRAMRKMSAPATAPSKPWPSLSKPTARATWKKLIEPPMCVVQMDATILAKASFVNWAWYCVPR